MRSHWLSVAALCAACGGRAVEGADSTGTENDILAELHAARPFAEGEYDYLGAAWPEMQDFLRRHKLVR